MAFLDVFSDWKDNSVTVTRTANDIVSGVPVESTSTIGTYNVIIYRGSQAEAVVAEKIRERVSMVLIFDPTVDVQDKDVITVNGKRYSAIEPDDIGMQGDALLVPVEKIS